MLADEELVKLIDSQSAGDSEVRGSGVSTVKIKRLRELVKEVTRGACKEQPLHIPPDYEHDADLVIAWAADHIEDLEEIVSGKASYTRNGVIYRMQPVERRTGGRRAKD